ncbi:LacI family DNA-binding transcriptional regulator [Ramlibacter monticola]|uniref:LacI family DNA-binding transcriptional regulator n=1 Tax=Ramlibacter monticola TaxID=1926872 RepID=A0A936Z324_9BURK|nr:LacI family DNA-binding transcriptional regulator [Ramlibacter monticola]MBL0392981.1 LacI family DNA-binding transcriptional regulator [Ramlibacter monticola]
MSSRPTAEFPTPTKPNARARAASLEDVAALAGVSPGTVSRALSRPEMISEATRQRVLEAADRIGYVPNGAARAMAMRRTLTVGAVIPRFGTSSFPTMVQALETTLAERGYTLLLAAPDNKGSQTTDMVRTLLARGVDALALLGSRHPQEVFALLKTQGTPFVQLWTQDDALGPCVGFDESQAAALVVDHLADFGHREIGFIGGYTRNNERAEARLAGLMRAVAKRGLTLREDATVETEYGLQQGFDAMERIRLGGSPVSAVVCGNDYLAAGALAALDQAGVPVPQRLSVASFNDNEFAPFMHPPLTTVHLPIQEMGEQAGRHLLAVLQNQAPEAAAPLPVHLVIRRSTGPRG